VDLNTATAEELDALPGVGPATAAAIIDHRRRNGPFRSVDELADVRGIGDAKLAQLRDLVRV
jgi:competence protein ComEA